jgi:hypothetical protein
MTTRLVGTIIASFNVTVRDLLGRLSARARSDEEVCNLDRLRKRINLLKTTMGDGALIDRVAPVLVEHAELILGDPARREQFILSLDVRAEYIQRKGVINKQDEFIFSLTDSIRTQYIRAQERERESLYIDLRTLLTQCIEYTVAKTC